MTAGATASASPTSGGDGAGTHLQPAKPPRSAKRRIRKLEDTAGSNALDISYKVHGTIRGQAKLYILI